MHVLKTYDMENDGIVRQWLRDLNARNTATTKDTRNYWNNNPKSLLTSSSVHSLTFGTGCAIYNNSILPAIEAADLEVIIVTCFWARSSTLDGLNSTLLKLSDKGKRNGRKVRVRICFSSSSLFQKLFHTPSLQGRTYSPLECERKLGLPTEDELSGVELEAKSIFVLPFSVMHPKFVIIDRAQVLLPSCNVSWEDWFEGCVELSGPVTEQFVLFWTQFWASDQDRSISFDASLDTNNRYAAEAANNPKPLGFHAIRMSKVESIFLPSPHHQNPKFTLPLTKCAPPPMTPLNAFLLWAFSNAKKTIYIQSPNLTSPPVLSALLTALKSGIHITILTSERLMILEQLVTAGTTTLRCMKKLIKRHKSLVTRWQETKSGTLEAGLSRAPGSLQIKLYLPNPNQVQGRPEPLQSHLKLTIIDGEWTVFGSGNLDRASWYTSQELGVAFFASDLASKVRTSVDSLMDPRHTSMYANIPAR